MNKKRLLNMKKLSDEQKRNRLILILLLVMFSITIPVYFLIGADKEKKDPASSSGRVSSVIDGDTFDLESGERVRLICVDAPEKGDKGYDESKKFLEFLILNKEVKLEKDVSETDKFERILRYVYLNNTDKEIFVNKELFDGGYAKIMMVEPDIKRCGEIASK
jgi:micrococcal nuclease